MQSGDVFRRFAADRRFLPFIRFLGQPIFWLFWLLPLHILYLRENYRDDVSWDVEQFYFPMAKRLLLEGWRFLVEQESAYYPLLTYAYPALFGADALIIKIANCILSLAIVLILYRCGSLLFSRWAGLAAATLYATSPSLLPLMPTALTEAPYIFLSVLWFWALCELFSLPETDQCSHSLSGKPLVLVGFGGLALGLATNMRANWLYAIYVSALLLPLLIWRFKQHEMATFLKRAWYVQLIALTLCVLVIAKNAVFLGFPALTAGAGNALYYGMHPVNQGMEPYYIGLSFDDLAATGGVMNLSPEGDRQLKEIGIMMLKDKSLGEGVEYFGQKLGRWLFFPNNLLPQSWDTPWDNPRSQRIVLLLLAICGMFAVWFRGAWRERTLGVTLFSILSYQTALHLPVLYSARYSTGSLDVWLILLAGVGLAVLTEWMLRLDISLGKGWQSRLTRAGAIAALAWGCLYVGVWHRHYYGVGQTLRLQPEHYAIQWKHDLLPPDVLRDALPSVQGGFVATGPHPSFAALLPSPEAAPGVYINRPQIQANLALQLDLHFDTKTGQCTNGALTYSIHKEGRALLG
jgi:hypothetical protein